MSHASFVPMRAEPRNRTLLRGVRRSLGWSANCVLPYRTAKPIIHTRTASAKPPIKVAHAI